MDETRSPLRTAISDLESPLTSAEAAATTLNMIVDDLGNDNESVAVVYLADMIRTHLNDLRERFNRVSAAAFKGE